MLTTCGINAAKNSVFSTTMVIQQKTDFIDLL